MARDLDGRQALTDRKLSGNDEIQWVSLPLQKNRRRKIKKTLLHITPLPFLARVSEAHTGFSPVRLSLSLDFDRSVGNYHRNKQRDTDREQDGESCARLRRSQLEARGPSSSWLPGAHPPGPAGSPAVDFPRTRASSREGQGEREDEAAAASWSLLLLLRLRGVSWREAPSFLTCALFTMGSRLGGGGQVTQRL